MIWALALCKDLSSYPVCIFVILFYPIDFRTWNLAFIKSHTWRLKRSMILLSIWSGMPLLKSLKLARRIQEKAEWAFFGEFVEFLNHFWLELGMEFLLWWCNLQTAYPRRFVTRWEANKVVLDIGWWKP